MKGELTKNKQRHLDWINSYIVAEDFPEEHLIALTHIVGLFNDSKESERKYSSLRKRCMKSMWKVTGRLEV